MDIRNKQNFVSGLFFLAFGGFCAIVARGYSLGTTEDIGAGYFPFWVAVLLSVLGGVLCLTSLARSAERTDIARLDWRSTLWIVGAVLLFAFLLPIMGVVISVLALVVVSSLGSHEFSWKGTLVSSSVLAVTVYAVFVKGLHLQFPTWPTFF